jgi:hypothetical protein
MKRPPVIGARKNERTAAMALAAVANFERVIDRVAPAMFLTLGVIVAVATALVGA